MARPLDNLSYLSAWPRVNPDDVSAACKSVLIAPKTTMSATAIRTCTRETLNLRIHSEERNLIDRAALARGTNRTDFILGAARRAAEDALLGRASGLFGWKDGYGE